MTSYVLSYPIQVVRELLDHYTVDKLKLWYKTRGLTPPDGNKAVLIAGVRRRMEIEDGMRQQGEVIRLRDPTGGFALKYFLATRPEMLPHFPQVDPSYAAPPADNPDWVVRLDDISAAAPILERSVMRAHYQAKITHPDSQTRVWVSGYKRMKNYSQLREYMYHGPTETHPKRCWLQWQVPCGMKAGTYPVSICMAFTPAQPAHGIVPKVPKLVTRILCVACACIVGGSGYVDDRLVIQ